MELAKLVNSLPAATPPADRLLVERAHAFAARQHSGQMRASGHPYLQHCMAVAEILAGLHLPAAAIAAALLHDVVEDTSATVADLQREFNPEIARLVDGVTKLTQQVARVDKAGAPEPAPVSAGAISAQRADTIRKTFLAMGDDVRIMLIKLADRLHNMRTLAHLPAAKRERIAQETLDIFAPLANRLGIWQFKWELEDLGMRHTNPGRYKELAAALQMGHGDRERVMDEIMKRMERELHLHGISADVTGRPKHLYSIWRKMERKEVTFEKVFDVRALRVVVHSAAAEPDEDEKAHERREKLAIANCYVVLGLAHQIWKPIPGEFDDYIATPKDNFYRSLHTAVVYADGKTLEVQIRTREMDQNAELGIAAHWRYKEGSRKLDKSFDQRVAWLRSMMDWRSAVTDGPEFVDALKSDLFPDRVLIFTPRGDIIDLPAGATPIDFAYHVHTSVGERCRGSKVNGKLVPLNYALHTGERVEIL
ncbi:MAG: pyrophosphokinae, partial [Chloroflexota bacterium]